MINVLDNMDKCTGCSSCSQICPQGCIDMVFDQEGFLFPRVKSNNCTRCNACRRACPVFQFQKDTEKGQDSLHEKKTPKVYACVNNREDIRLCSTSGGAFSAIAENTLKKGGVIFGAAFNDQFQVIHTSIEAISQLDQLRRSKYVQSDMSDSYRMAGELLKSGRQVLFSGTPCQIAGLKSFLGKEDAGLLTCEIACHGVPSPKVWSMYLEYMKHLYKSNITLISFRDKTEGWNKSSMRICFENGRQYMENVYKEPYFMGFGKSIFNRKSCFDCNFRLKNTKADITLADFWGIEKLPIQNQLKEKGFHNGISLVIVSSEKGRKVIDEISKEIYLEERTLEEAVSGNPRLVSSCIFPKKRASFFYHMNKGYSFHQLKRKYMNNKGFKYIMKKIIKTLIRR